MKGMEKMSGECLLEKLKTEIENKRKKLNELIVSAPNKDELLKFSTELDQLIEKYYGLELNKKRADY